MAVPTIESLPPLADKLESAKRAAAYRAIDENIDFQNDRVIGIGSGSTVVYAAERLGQYLKDSEYSAQVAQFICIPTGFQSRRLILDNGLKLGSIEENAAIDVDFDGADEIDTDLNLIKGGGACLFQEKLVSTSSKKFVVVADYRKKAPKYLSTNWKSGIPIEIVPSAYVRVSDDLKKLGANHVIVRQGGSAKAGPVVTDNNNFLIDADFGMLENPAQLHDKIKALVGVVETGLFIDNACKAYIGNADGSVNVFTK